ARARSGLATSKFSVGRMLRTPAAARAGERSREGATPGRAFPITTSAEAPAISTSKAAQDATLTARPSMIPSAISRWHTAAFRRAQVGISQDETYLLGRRQFGRGTD